MQLASPAALVFDLDGVLADVSGSYRQAMIESAARFGVTLTLEEIAAAKTEGDANNDWILTQRLLARRGVDAPLDEVTAHFESAYQGTEHAPGLWTTETLLVPVELIARLSARRPLAIVTGRPRLDAERFLAHFELADYFPVTVCMGEAPAKPDPAPVRLALSKLGLGPSGGGVGWMVGDTPDDVRAAVRAGCVGLGIVAPGEDPAQMGAALTAAGATMILDHLGQLEDLLP